MREYWDFPRSIQAFGESMPTARLVEIGGCLFRRAGRNKFKFTLVRFGDPMKAVEVIRHLLDDGHKVSSLNFSRNDAGSAPSRFYGLDFSLSRGGAILAEFDALPKNWRYILRTHDKDIQMVNGAATFALQDEIWGLFEDWRKWAQERHFMVFIGHYKRWLELYFQDRGPCDMIVYVDGVNGSVVGVSGWEVDGDAAQIVLMKHVHRPRDFAQYIWMDSLREIFSINPSVREVFCGTTADALKQKMRLESRKSWVFDIKKIGG